jgi:hypothetical protein
MGTQEDRNAKKFAEPRGWAAKWCGYGLDDRRGPTTLVRTYAHSSVRKFAEPRGWAAKWCGDGLSEGGRQ